MGNEEFNPFVDNRYNSSHGKAEKVNIPASTIEREQGETKDRLPRMLITPER